MFFVSTVIFFGFLCFPLNAESEASGLEIDDCLVDVLLVVDCWPKNVDVGEQLGLLADSLSGIPSEEIRSGRIRISLSVAAEQPKTLSLGSINDKSAILKILRTTMPITGKSALRSVINLSIQDWKSSIRPDASLVMILLHNQQELNVSDYFENSKFPEVLTVISFEMEMDVWARADYIDGITVGWRASPEVHRFGHEVMKSVSVCEESTNCLLEPENLIVLFDDSEEKFLERRNRLEKLVENLKTKGEIRTLDSQHLAINGNWTDSIQSILPKKSAENQKHFDEKTLEYLQNHSQSSILFVLKEKNFWPKFLTEQKNLGKLGKEFFFSDSPNGTFWECDEKLGINSVERIRLPRGDSECDLDIVLVIDVSQSVEDDFPAQIDFASKLVRKIPDSAIGKRIRVSAVAFHTESRIVFPFGEFVSVEGIIGSLNSIEHMGGSTSVVSGIQLAAEIIEKESRPNAQRLVVLVTDGNSQDPWADVLKASTRIHSTESKVFSITLSRDHFVRELDIYSGDHNFVFSGKNTDKFLESFGTSVSKCSIPIVSTEKTLPIAAFARDEAVSAVGSAESSKFLCSGEKWDLVLILDASTSREHVFEHQRELALSLVERLPLGDHRIATALSSFTSETNIRLSLAEGHNRSTIRQSIEEINYVGGSTLTAKAINAALEDLNTHKRSDAKSIVILFNDGMSQDVWSDVLKASSKLNESKAERFAVALGDEIDLRELRLYVDSEDRIYRDGSTERFLSDVVKLTGTEECNQCPVLEVIVLIDATKSHSPTDNYLFLDVLGSLDSQIRVAAFTFGQSSKLRQSFNDPIDRENLSKTLESMNSIGQKPSYVKAISSALDYYVRERRANSRGILLIVGDGKNSSDSSTERHSVAERLRLSSLGMSVYAVASQPNPDPSLNEFTGSSERVFGFHRNSEFAQIIRSLAVSNCGNINELSNTLDKRAKDLASFADQKETFEVSKQTKLRTKDSSKLSQSTTSLHSNLSAVYSSPSPLSTATEIISQQKLQNSNNSSISPKFSTASFISSSVASLFSVTQQTTKAIPKTATEPSKIQRNGKDECLIDLLLLLDTSGSVLATFERERELASELVESLRIGPQNAHIAVVKFASTGKIRTIQSFGDSLSKQQTLRRLREITPTSGTTAIHSALLQAVAEFTSRRGARPGIAQPIAVLFTDGFGQNDVSEESQLLRRFVPNLFAVAIGDHPMSRRDLEMITGDPKRIFTEKNIQSLHSEIHTIGHC